MSHQESLSEHRPSVRVVTSAAPTENRARGVGAHVYR
ncbi:hypothetical protein F4692_003828 [Nocardioides cavernae]|uniref:Uncharacterized protein n=1 Tax=Nocardioides cavernae TaxID=1921566 RepID=A0A7Y9H6A9_9ACTN|nr:hypothetical protein [Nocardioides cavernae]